MAGQTTTRARSSAGGSTRAGARGGARRARTRSLAGPSTGFAWLRLIGSVIVVVEHSGPILHPDKITIFPGEWIQTPGYIALMAFFAMSGYQISESWRSDPVAWRFMFKRVLRIWPPLLFVVLVTTLLIGPLVTVLSAGDYFSSRDTWGYILNNATLYNIQHLLPGVFVDNPYPWSANGSLWTLSMEFTGYLIVLAIGLLGVFRGARVLLWPLLVGLMVADGMFGAVIGFGGNAGSFLQTPIGATVSFMVAFVIGMIMYRYRDEIPLHGYVALGLLVVYIALYFTPVARYLMPVMAGYGSIVLAHRWPAWCARYDTWVYCSYGLYVWAFPLQQLIVLAGVRSEVVVALLAVPASYLAGLMSWFLVEAPTQQLRRYLPKRPRVEQTDDEAYDDQPDDNDDEDDEHDEDRVPTVRREPVPERAAGRRAAAMPRPRPKPSGPPERGQPRRQERELPEPVGPHAGGGRSETEHADPAEHSQPRRPPGHGDPSNGVPGWPDRRRLDRGFPVPQGNGRAQPDRPDHESPDRNRPVPGRRGTADRDGLERRLPQPGRRPLPEPGPPDRPAPERGHQERRGPWPGQPGRAAHERGQPERRGPERSRPEHAEPGRARHRRDEPAPSDRPASRGATPRHAQHDGHPPGEAATRRARNGWTPEATSEWAPFGTPDASSGNGTTREHATPARPGNGATAWNGAASNGPRPPRPGTPEPAEETSAIPRYGSTAPRHAARSGDVDWFGVTGDIEEP